MVPPGVNQPAFFRTTGLGSPARAASKAVTASIGVDELAHELGGPRPDVRVRVSGQVLQRGSEDLVRARSAGAARAPVAGQGVERGDPDPGVGIVGHGDELAHRVGVDQVVQETAAALADGRILMPQASADRAHRVRVAPQQLVIGRYGTLRITQARDEGLIVGPDKPEHDVSLRPHCASRQRNFGTRARVCRTEPERPVPHQEKPAAELVGVAGFEPAASSSRTKRAAKLRYTPPTPHRNRCRANRR
jgi:hypothetical protein